MTTERRPAFPELLRLLERHARPAVLGDFRADSCIATTRVVVAVCRHFDEPANPIAVRLVVMNDPARRHLSRGGLGTPAARAAGAWAVDVGSPDSPMHGVGHLVAWLPRHRMIVDAAANQADRPERGIVLPPLVAVAAPAAFPAGGLHVGATFRAPRGAKERILVVYTATPERTEWQESADWLDPSRTRPIVDGIVAAWRAQAERS